MVSLSNCLHKYYNYRKLPEALFSTGNAFVPFVIVRSALTAFGFVSLVASSSIQELMDLVFGLPTHNQTAPVLAPFCLVPRTSSLAIWSHHVDHSNQLYLTMVATKFYRCCQRNNCIWTRSTFAGLTDLVNLEESWSANTCTCFMPTHQLFKVGQTSDHLVFWWVLWLPSTAMWIQIKRKIQRDAFCNCKYSWTGVTEPIEYMFMCLLLHHCIICSFG